MRGSSDYRAFKPWWTMRGGQVCEAVGEPRYRLPIRLWQAVSWVVGFGDGCGSLGSVETWC